MIHSTIRPLPYYSTDVNNAERDLARSLRAIFVPKVARRLPLHHLRGFRHNDVVNAVKRYKREYPFFLRTDIRRFYPNVRHTDVVVGVQLCWRDLLGLEYVPSSFKKTYVGPLLSWCRSLPVDPGIPLGSPLSAISAPLMLVPLWLELKRRFDIPFVVYMDDVLVMCRTEDEAAQVYEFLSKGLQHRYNLQLHPEKTSSGRFSAGSVEFCGWSFAGGYSRISAEKVSAFLKRVGDECRRRHSSARSLIKCVNRKISGFGHYYKYGDVKKQFEVLDYAVRKEVRSALVQTGLGGRIGNLRLHGIGLISLSEIYQRIQPQTGAAVKTCSRKELPRMHAGATAPVGGGDGEMLQMITDKLTQLVALQRKQYRLLQNVACSIV